MFSSDYISRLSRLIFQVITLAFVSLFLILPLCVIISESFGGGLKAYLNAISHPDTLLALGLTFLAVIVTLPLNVLFGIVAAWALTKYEFRGKSLLSALIDLPFAVPPVIAGFILILYLGKHGVFGSLLEKFDLNIIFSTPAIVIATLFVTIPFVARELIPLMQEQGTEEEQAAVSLGASTLQTFFYVTLPNIKWALLYGIILTVARSMGEFGAVSVLSGHIRGKTVTLPLHIEILYNEYNFTAAFAVSSLLMLLALLTLIAKEFFFWKLNSGGSVHQVQEDTVPGDPAS
ncbi:MAG: sulfate ABC transporter permease subunit CysW [Candidatus Hydrogenedens sp.]|jgi:sulfate transport system permease protein|nr:sulfate ABC transporter permease subunit CysW [Candidatus Hydrogenedens sp.]